MKCLINKNNIMTSLSYEIESKKLIHNHVKKSFMNEKNFSNNKNIHKWF